VDETTFSANATTGNGTLANYGSASVRATTFYTNTAFRGAGIYSEEFTTLWVSNSTFAYGTATEGGGIHNRGAMTVTNSTFAYNNANFGRAIQTWNGTMSLYNNILAYNTGNNEACYGDGLVASVNNLITDGSCSTPLTDDPLSRRWAATAGQPDLCTDLLPSHHAGVPAPPAAKRLARG
jgi:hypothetical protein